ncbi:hypothetical protein ACU8KH_01887 [Lachancea thermotolerans]
MSDEGNNSRPDQRTIQLHLTLLAIPSLLFPDIWQSSGFPKMSGGIDTSALVNEVLRNTCLKNPDSFHPTD